VPARRRIFEVPPRTHVPKIRVSAAFVGGLPRFVRFHSIGGPEVLQIDELAVGAPGPGEVRIRVRALGLNRAECMFRRWVYPEMPVLPARLGYEAAGEVEAVGEGVTRFSPGDVVSTIPAFSMNQYGVYGEVAIVPVDAVVKHPANLSLPEAASIWMQYLTVYGALVDYGRLSAGDAVIITAASSGVGLGAIQIAKSLCHTTFNLKNLKAAISMTYRSTRYLINDTLLDKFSHLPTSYLRIVS
jgi:NADPH:quinone reductase-like Zn-dependent oxidoreductase